jgi:HlyD family secretion protein
MNVGAKPPIDQQPARRRALIVGGLVAFVAVAAGYVVWTRSHAGPPMASLTLYGNVDLRQVDLAFNNSERIVSVSVQEGDRVHAGQILARLDTERLVPQVEEAQAQLDAQEQLVKRLHNGSRPEEVVQARAGLASARAEGDNAALQYKRLETLSEQSAGRGVSKQDLDSANSALAVARAKVVLNQKTLELALSGPRREDVAQAEAQSRAIRARLHLLQKQLADSELRAPSDAVVRSRLMEPGEMATPERPVLSLAIVNPKWVRGYLPESDLGKIHSGMLANVSADSFPGRRYAAWVGFVSPVAEFTPRTVQTTELRTSLVYEVRVFVKDEADELRLGMPATVQLALGHPVADIAKPAGPAAANASLPALPAKTDGTYR